MRKISNSSTLRKTTSMMTARKISSFANSKRKIVNSSTSLTVYRVTWRNLRYRNRKLLSANPNQRSKRNPSHCLWSIKSSSPNWPTWWKTTRASPADLKMIFPPRTWWTCASSCWTKTRLSSKLLRKVLRSRKNSCLRTSLLSRKTFTFRKKSSSLKRATFQSNKTDPEN